MFAGLCTVFAILVILGLWVTLYDSHHFVVVKYAFSSDKIKKPVRLVMISDLHNYQYGRENGQLLSAIEEAAPDMIVIAGDMVTARAKEKYDGTIALLKKLKEKYPLYYAYGNHEQKINLYPKRYGDTGEGFEKALAEAGIEPLRNSHIAFPDKGIDLYGLEIDHSYYQRFEKKPMDGGYLEKLLGKKETGLYTVLLAHNPDYFPEYAGWGADLVLSGHIHGGIIRVPFLGGFISPSMRLFPKYDGGLFKEGQADMVLGRGLGTHSPKVRMFNPAELVVVDLMPEDTEKMW